MRLAFVARLRLLTAQHSLSDLGRVGETDQPRLDHSHAGCGHPGRDLCREPRRHLVRVVAQGERA